MRSPAALRLTRFTLALVLGGTLAWLVATMGPAATVTAATTTDTTGATDTGGAALTRTETKTITEPARTDTVTETAQPPGDTSVTNRTATVQVTPAATTSSDQSSTSGLPWWGWALIVLGAIVIGLVMFMAGRHRSSRPPTGPAGPAQPPAQGPGGYA